MWKPDSSGSTTTDDRMPIVDLWLSVAGKPWAYIRLVEILLDKGPLAAGQRPQATRVCGERRAVPGVSLSDRLGHGVVTLDSARAATQEWFKGTLKAVYDTESQGDVADHRHRDQRSCRGRRPQCDTPITGSHRRRSGELPGAAAGTNLRRAWNKRPARISCERVVADGLATSAQLVRPTSWECSRADSGIFCTGPCCRAMSGTSSSRIRPRLTAIRGRPVLLLANHQVQVESILGTTVASWLTGTQVVTIAHAKHENRWIGGLLRLVEAVTGSELGHIRYFDQQNPRQFFRLVEDMKSDVAAHGVSTMVHADGTRYVRSGQRVERLTSTLLDMATDLSMPVVPMYFAGGLPEEPLDHKLEVPYRQAAQDYIFGRPIMPEELTALLYPERRRHVIDAINALAPFSDAPHEPNYLAENRIDAASPVRPRWSRYGVASKTRWMPYPSIGERRSAATNGPRPDRPNSTPPLKRHH